MHICFLTDEYPPFEHGGIGTFTQTLGRALVKRGHGVTVIGSYPVDKTLCENDDGVSVIRLPYFPIARTGFLFNSLCLRRELSRLHKKTTVDILEGPNRSLSLVPCSFPASKVLRIHSTISTTKKPRLLRYLSIKRAFQVADYVCAVSDSSGERNRQNLRLGNIKIETLYNPVDTSYFSPSPDQEEDGFILFVGTICENKGTRQLIQAMPQIVEKVPEAKLCLVGRDWFDSKNGSSFTKELQNMIPPSLEKHIVFTGVVAHAKVRDLIARAQLCVYPSHMENMPVAWLEAMAMGKAIVASQTGPGPEVIEDGVSGLLCDPRDPASIARKVIKLLKNPDFRRSIGINARNRVVEHFSLDLLLDKNEQFYRRCLATSGAHPVTKF